MDCKTNYEAKCKALSEFYANAAANPDQPIEFKCIDDWANAEGWSHSTPHAAYGPDLNSDLSRWRVRPKVQKVYVVWLDCDWHIRGTTTSAPTFSSREDAERWNNEYTDGKGKIQELVRPD